MICIRLVPVLFQSVNHQSIHPSIHPSIYQSIHPSIHPSIHLLTRISYQFLLDDDMNDPLGAMVSENCSLSSWVCVEETDARSKQLCGFLGRQEGKLKTWRDRWFKLDEASGILFYYNNKTDPLHAGYAATSLM